MPKKRFEPRFTITNAIADAITRIERARGFLEAASLSEEWLSAMSDRALVLEAHHTTHIEGTQLTLEQSERLLAGKKVRGADPDDTRELLNYGKAFDLVSEYLESGDPVTELLIKEIHRQLVKGVRGGKAAPGQYRKVQNHVINSTTGKTIYTPPPPGEVPILMRELVMWLNRDTGIHPILTSGIAQFQLVHIHPFLDGNGRTSRLLSTLLLYRAGYDFKRLFTMSEFYDRKRAAFYRAIQSVREKNMNMTGWLEYFVKGLATQMREVTQRGRQAIRLDVLTHKHGLTDRHATLLGYVLGHGALTIQEYENLFPDLNRRTLQRDLKALIDKGLLIERGTSPTDPTKRYELRKGVR